MLFKIEVVILTRNRLKYLKESFNLIYKSLKKEKNIYLKISDNSSNNKIKLFFNNFANLNKANFNYINRGGVLSAKKHYDIIFSESKYDYTIILHDDDYVSPNYFDQICKAIVKYPTAVAIGTNANLIKNNKNLRKYSHYYNKNIEFKNKTHFLKQYLTGSDGICPFPSYVYKTNYIKNIKYSKYDAGKHSDVIFLTNLLNNGTIVWLKDKLFNYRIHDLQDSKIESVIGRILLKKYFLANNIKKKNTNYVLFNLFYRYNLYIQYLRNNKNKKNARKIFEKYFCYVFLKLIFKFQFYKIIYKKMYRNII